jgi:hypothetical protein
MNKALEVCKTAKGEFEQHGIHTYLYTLLFAKNLPTHIAFIHCIFTHVFIVAGHRKQYAWSRGIQEKCRRNSRLFGY